METYKLRLHGRNILLLHDAIYALGVRVCLLLLVSLLKLGFFFNSHIDGILYDGNVFGHATLKNDFLVLDLDDCYNNTSFAFVSHFGSFSGSVKWHVTLKTYWRT